MKILYLLPAEKFGGAERQGAMAIKYLPKYGIDVVPVIGPGKMIVEAFDRENISNYVYSKTFPDDPKRPLVLLETLKRCGSNYACFLQSLKLTKQLIKQHNIDLIYASRPFSWIVSGYVSKSIGIPIVWRCGGRFYNDIQRLIIKHFMAWTAPRGLVFTCDAMRESFQFEMSVPWRIVSHSVDTQRFNPHRNGFAFRERWGIAKEDKVIGIAARPAPEKGPEFAAGVLKYLVSKDPKIKLVWAGESAWRHVTEKIFKDAGVADNSKFLGHVSQIEDFYSACDAVMLTSTVNSIETSPNAVLEPMAMAKPVVATRVGGLHEIVSDGEDGCLIEFGATDKFSDALLKVLNDKEFSRRIGDAANKRIHVKHNPEVNVKKLAKDLKEFSVLTHQALRLAEVKW